MKTFFGLAALCGVAAASFGQAAQPVVTWEVSGDGGTTWSSHLQLDSNGPSNISVRGRLGWQDSSTLGTALAVVSFDGIITGTLGETGGNVNRPLHQATFGDNGALVNLGNGAFRFSAASDSGQPGSNSTWWVIGQDGGVGSPDGTWDTSLIVTSNPVVFLTFDLAIDLSASHSMNISCLFNPIVGRAARVRYQTAHGSFFSQVHFNANQMTMNGATIEVLVPTPGVLSMGCLGALVAIRRRR